MQVAIIRAWNICVSPKSADSPCFRIKNPAYKLAEVNCGGKRTQTWIRSRGMAPWLCGSVDCRCNYLGGGKGGGDEWNEEENEESRAENFNRIRAEQVVLETMAHTGSQRSCTNRTCGCHLT